MSNHPCVLENNRKPSNLKLRMAQKNGRKSKINGREATQFKPGHPGGPGRPKVPFELKEAWKRINDTRGESLEGWVNILSETRNLSYQDLISLSKDESQDVIRLTIARARIFLASKPNPTNILKWLRIECGAEPKQVEISGPGGESLSPLSGIPKEALLEVFWKIKNGNQCLTKSPQEISSESSPQSAAPSPQPSSPSESCEKK